MVSVAQGETSCQVRNISNGEFDSRPIGEAPITRKSTKVSVLVLLPNLRSSGFVVELASLNMHQFPVNGTVVLVMLVKIDQV